MSKTVGLSKKLSLIAIVVSGLFILSVAVVGAATVASISGSANLTPSVVHGPGGGGGTVGSHTTSLCLTQANTFNYNTTATTSGSGWYYPNAGTTPPITWAEVVGGCQMDACALLCSGSYGAGVEVGTSFNNGGNVIGGNGAADLVIEGGSFVSFVYGGPGGVEAINLTYNSNDAEVYDAGTCYPGVGSTISDSVGYYLYVWVTSSPGGSPIYSETNDLVSITGSCAYNSGIYGFQSYSDATGTSIQTVADPTLTSGNTYYVYAAFGCGTSITEKAPANGADGTTGCEFYNSNAGPAVTALSYQW